MILLIFLSLPAFSTLLWSLNHLCFFCHVCLTFSLLYHCCGFLFFFLYFCLIASNVPIFLTADVISTVEFNQTGDLLATGDKGGRVVIFQRETEVSLQCKTTTFCTHAFLKKIASYTYCKCMLKAVFSSLSALGSRKVNQRRWARQGTLGSTMSTARFRATSLTLTT